MKSKNLLLASVVVLGCGAMGAALAAGDDAKKDHHPRHLVCSSSEARVQLDKTDACHGKHHWEMVATVVGHSCDLKCLDLSDHRSPVQSDADDKDLKDKGVRVHPRLLKEKSRCSDAFAKALDKEDKPLVVMCREEKRA